MEFEYRVVPAPKRLKKARGVTTEEAFAHMLTEAINAEARLGWEYLRAETMTAQGARGPFRRAVLVEETLLVFRRQRLGPRIVGTPHEVAPEPELRLPETPAVRPARREPEARPRNGRAAGAEPEAAAPEAPRRSGDGEAAPPLLRPVPRFRPGEPS
jgi:hypothetical protein